VTEKSAVARSDRGFILQQTYRIESGRPVVLIYGTLESGRPFLLRDTRQQPGFWVLAEDGPRAASMGARIVRESPPRTTLRGEPASAVVVRRPQDTVPLRDRLVSAGIPCFEADVRFAYRYLIDRGIRGALSIRGPSRAWGERGLVFEDAEIEPADWAPTLSVLSVDIETDSRASRLLSVALVGCGAAEVLLLTPDGMDCPPEAVACETERELLGRLVERVRELDPDVITGWNVVDFDVATLSRIGQRVGVPLALGRDGSPARVDDRPTAGSRGAHVTGRVVLDGIQLLRGAFVRLDSYSLEGASQELLGRGKTITGKDRAAEILDAFREDRSRLVAYNLNDAQLVLDILDKLRLVQLAVRRSLLTGMPPDRVAASIASFDFLYLTELGRRRIVAPSVGGGFDDSIVTSGGHVLEPEAGLHDNVLVLDFKSLYPSIIRTFQIDPLGYLPAPTPGIDPIVAPNGAAFRRDPGILPGLLDRLFPLREQAKLSGDSVTSQAIKILMNSFYGVLGTPACRFASPALANAITGFGKHFLLWSKAQIESWGYAVLYGDTDSLFVASGQPDPAKARDTGVRIVARLNDALADYVRESWRVDIRLELEFEKLYLRLLLPEARHGGVGARKRYAGLVDRQPRPELEFTGMEAVRRDWTQLARRVQRELYRRLFFDEPVDAYVHEIVASLRSGALDSELVYRKALRKPLHTYTASTPPHVAAARRASRPPGRVVRYVVTTDGPEPADERSAPIDHEHYVQRQVRAVAESVLVLLGLDFDTVIGDDRQGRLF
jgi:DNA polymerase-2